MRGHDPVVINKFMGLWDRNPADPTGVFGPSGDESVPLDHGIQCRNMVFNSDGVRSRPGMSLVAAAVTGGNGFYRKHTFSFSGGDRDLFLDTLLRLIDRTTAAVLVAAPVGANDFCLVNLFDRCYISFFNTDTGLGISGSSVYVYDGTTIRVAGGTAPVGAITAVNGAAGKVEVGQHAFAVAFETASGFITKAAGFVNLNATGALQANLSTIPVGPAGTVARHILATKVAYTGWVPGNWNDIEFFFIPGARIGDNVTTVLNVNFYDADLVASGDYLLDELVTIPAGSSMCELDGKLCLAGFPSPDGSLVRVSKSGQPESFSAIDGFILVRPGDGGNVRALVTYRDSLMIHKEMRTSMTRDNGLPPASWVVFPVDNSIGTPSCAGISSVLNVNGPTVDYYLVVSRTGLEKYSGGYGERPLTWKIDKLWQRITPLTMSRIQIVDDTKNKCIYITVPMDGTLGITNILHANYELGLDPDNIKWSFWSFSVNVRNVSAVLDTVTKKALIHIIDDAANIYLIDPAVRNDLNAIFSPTAIDFIYQTAYIGNDDDVDQNHFTALKIRLSGSGPLTPVAYSFENQAPFPLNLPVIGPGLLPIRSVICGPFSFTTAKASFKFGTLAEGNVYQISRVAVYVKPIYTNRPS
jgi:hypothetical protein